MEAVGEPLITRVQLANYRSIESCDVTLRQFAVIVGRNGSGKSHFLDALHFTAEALRENLDFALRRRGGFREVRRRSSGDPFDVRVSLSLRLPTHSSAEYSFTLASNGDECQVKTEKLDLVNPGNDHHGYEVKGGWVSGFYNPPEHAPDRLYLVAVSGMPQFRPVFDALSGMRFYNLIPARMRQPIEVDRRSYLAEDGSNIGAAIGQLEKMGPATEKRIEEYLSKILPGLTRVERVYVGSRETVRFGQNDWTFEALQMSDGTLRALGVLTAVLANGASKARLIGIEEPEIALHPAAFGVLRDALREGSESRQVIVTSQSPELLDDSRLRPEEIIAARLDNGLTRLGPVDSAALKSLQDHLMTAGELLRQDALEPAIAGMSGVSGRCRGRF